MKQKTVAELQKTINLATDVLKEEIEKKIVTSNLSYSELVKKSDSISIKYWLMQLLDPLNKKELKDFVDGFLIQLINDEQADKLVKFLLIRFPECYERVASEKPDSKK